MRRTLGWSLLRIAAKRTTLSGGTVNVTSALQIGGTAVTPSATELNYTDGAAGALLAGPATGRIVKAGTVAVGDDGNPGTVATGLTTVEVAVASLYGANLPAEGLASVQVASLGGGTIAVQGICGLGTANWTAGTAQWIAIGV